MENHRLNTAFLFTLLHGMVTGLVINKNCTILSDNYYSPVFNRVTWIYKDWLTRRAEINSEFGPVTDRRWDSFGPTYNNYSQFVNLSSIPFSFYSDGNFDIHLNDVTKPTTECVPITVKHNNCQWAHFNIIRTNNNVVINKNGYINRTIDIHADQIVIKSKEHHFWKWHNYTFLEADHVTEEKPSTLVLSPGNTRYTLYTSLCQECYLDLKITNSRINITASISSFATCKFNKCWNEYDLFEGDIEEETKVHIFRRNYLNKTTGYWALDIRSWINSDIDNSKTTNISGLTVTLISVAIISFLVVLFFAIRRKTTRFETETNDNLLTTSEPHEG